VILGRLWLRLWAWDWAEFDRLSDSPPAGAGLVLLGQSASGCVVNERTERYLMKALVRAQVDLRLPPHPPAHPAPLHSRSSVSSFHQSVSVIYSLQAVGHNWKYIQSLSLGIVHTDISSLHLSLVLQL